MNLNLTLQTQRLTLRDFKKTDWKAVHSYACDPEVTRYLPFGPNSEEDSKNFLQTAIALQQEEPRRNFPLAVVLKAHKRIIGSCRISITDPQNQEGSIGYCFNKEFWGQGYASETASALLAFGFEQLSLHRIFALCEPKNVSSERVLVKIGMRREGYLREHQWMKGEWRDSLVYAILAHEWREMLTRSMQ